MELSKEQLTAIGGWIDEIEYVAWKMSPEFEDDAERIHTLMKATREIRGILDI